MRRAGLLAVLVLALAFASIPQGVGWGQNANFGTVRALAHGHAYIDAYRSETGDVAYYRGHYYSTKAPGLALLTVGPYYVLDHIGVVGLMGRLPGTANSEVGTLWLLTILGCALPIALALLLVRRIAGEVSPGLGTAAALTVGLGTLLLPFATIFYDHALSSSLAFAAFAVLWWRRDRLLACAAAGLLAGLAVTAEYPLALVAIMLGLYALLTAPAGARLRRGAAYAAAAVVGVIPIFVFNWLAFGSPTHITYENGVISNGGVSGHDVLTANARGFFGVSKPSFEFAVNLLFANIGLLTVAPVLAVAAAGVVLLYRRGHRAEAVLIGALPVVYLVYNAGYVDPWGGWTPGPRFLIPILLFLAIPLALAYRSWPLTTLALAVPSIVTMIGVTVTSPILNFNGSWYKRIENGSFYGHGVIGVVPFGLLVLASIALCVRDTPRPRFAARETVGAAVAVAGWILVRVEDWALLRRREPGYAALLALAVVVVVVMAHRNWRAGRVRQRLETA